MCVSEGKLYFPSTRIRNTTCGFSTRPIKFVVLVNPQRQAVRSLLQPLLLKTCTPRGQTSNTLNTFNTANLLSSICPKGSIKPQMLSTCAQVQLKHTHANHLCAPPPPPSPCKTSTYLEHRQLITIFYQVHKNRCNPTGKQEPLRSHFLCAGNGNSHVTQTQLFPSSFTFMGEPTHRHCGSCAERGQRATWRS